MGFDGTVRRAGTSFVLVAFVAGFLLFVGSPTRAVEALRAEVRAPLHQGVTWSQVRVDAPQLALDVAHVEPGAPVRLVPVVSGGQLAENAPAARNARTSSMCAAVGGVVCVNADFWVCASCGVPIGGVVHRGVPLRTPAALHPQVTLLDDGRLVSDPLEIDVRLVATFEPEEQEPVEGLLDEPEPPREEVVVVDAVNRGLGDGITLFSPHWARSTQSPEGTVEAVVGGAIPAIGGTTEVGVRGTGGPDSAIPADGFVLAATGSARDRFDDQVEAMRTADRLELHITANLPAQTSIGGHPIVLHDGQRVALDHGDGKVRNRHPRTLIGWNDAGHVWLVTVDGRQPGHSVGVTLDEATEMLVRLGATDALNLDGGGSSTFVTGVPCSDGRAPCIRNAPSDGRERSVTTALALVPADGTTLSTTPTPPPPAPPPTTTAPPTTAAPTTTAPPPPTTTTTAPPTTTTTAPPTTTAAPTTTAPGPVLLSDQPGQLAVIPADAPRSRTGPAVAAAMAIVMTASLTARVWTRHRSLGPTR